MRHMTWLEELLARGTKHAILSIGHVSSHIKFVSLHTRLTSLYARAHRACGLAHQAIKDPNHAKILERHADNFNAVS